jgi:hypothetical protein
VARAAEAAHADGRSPRRAAGPGCYAHRAIPARPSRRARRGGGGESPPRPRWRTLRSASAAVAVHGWREKLHFQPMLFFFVCAF